MKKIEVNNKCNGCGLCIMNCTYLEEDDEGNACPVLGMIVKDDDLEAVKKVVAECPKHALKMLNPDKFSKILTFYFIKVVPTVGKSLSILYPEHT